LAFSTHSQAIADYFARRAATVTRNAGRFASA
jgi:hypothetical protein